jgi:hypothetical protein
MVHDDRGFDSLALLLVHAAHPGSGVLAGLQRLLGALEEYAVFYHPHCHRSHGCVSAQLLPSE